MSWIWAEAHTIFFNKCKFSGSRNLKRGIPYKSFLITTAVNTSLSNHSEISLVRNLPKTIAPINLFFAHFLFSIHKKLYIINHLNWLLVKYTLGNVIHSLPN